MKSYASSTGKWTGGINLKISNPKFNDDFWYDFNKEVEKVDTDVFHGGDFGQLPSTWMVPRLHTTLYVLHTCLRECEKVNLPLKF